MEDKYNTTLIGGLDSLNRSIDVAIEESLLIHNSSNDQIWIIGGIETKSRRVKLILSKDSSSQTIEHFINENFLEGTNFTHDVWPAYNVLNNNLNYTHEIHIHGGGDFGRGNHSTSHIENYWAQFKNLITRIYGTIPKKNYVLLVREIEFRINLGYKTKNEATELLNLIFQKIYELNKYDIQNFDDL